jgi:hypothetical protein
LNIGTDDGVEGGAGGEELRVEAFGAAFGAVDECLGREAGTGAGEQQGRRRAPEE